MLKPDMSAANRPTACTGTIVPSLAPATKVVTCSGAASTTATACGNGEVCLPTFDTSKGAANCIKHEGDVACPKELRTRFVVGASMQDGRSCTGKCTCATNDCLGGKVELYDATNCPAANLRRTIVIDGTCDTTTPATGGFGGSGRYFAPSGCEVKEAPTVTGTQTPVSPTTFCCMDGAPSPVH